MPQISDLKCNQSGDNEQTVSQISATNCNQSGDSQTVPQHKISPAGEVKIEDQSSTTMVVLKQPGCEETDRSSIQEDAC